MRFLAHFCSFAFLLVFSQPSFSTPRSRPTTNETTIPSAPVLQLDHSSTSLFLRDRLNPLSLAYRSHKVQKLSLDDAISAAIANNPGLLQAAEDVVSRGYDLQAAQNLWFPTLDLSSSKLPRIYNNTALNTSSQSSVTTRSVSEGWDSSLTLIGSWKFLDPTRGPQINASFSQLDADALLFFSTARDLIFNVQSLYYKLQGLSLLIKDYDSIVSSSRQTYSAISSKYHAGYANILQVEQVKAQLAENTTQLIDFHVEYLKTSSELSQFLGLPEYLLVMPSEPLSQVAHWSYSLDQTVDYGLKNNELIARSLALADSSKWLAYLELNRVLPSLTINLSAQQSFARSDAFQNSTFIQTGSEQTYDLSAYLSLEWRLFDGGANYSRADSGFAQQQKFLAESEGNRNLTVSSIRSAYSGMTGSLLSIDVTRQGYASAQVALDASRMRYAAGLDDVTTIVQATQLLAQASRQHSNSIVQYNTSIANLYRSAAVWPPSTLQHVNSFLSQKQVPRLPDMGTIPSSSAQ